MRGRAAVYPDERQSAIDAQAFFAALVVPDNWKCRGKHDLIELTPEGKEWTVSRGIVFRDIKTSGFGVKDYKIVIISASGKGAICEKTIDEERKPHYKCVIMNKTVQEINKYIEQHYL